MANIAPSAEGLRHRVDQANTKNADHDNNHNSNGKGNHKDTPQDGDDRPTGPHQQQQQQQRGGTGRLPRNAPFTPTYINAFTANSLIALVSLIVTVAFFYFKIVLGILQAHQLGVGEYLSGGPAHGAEGEPRPMIVPVCPEMLNSSPSIADKESDHIISDKNSYKNGNKNSKGDQDGCPHFGRIVVLSDSISEYGFSHATHGWLAGLADEWTGRADVTLRGFPGYNTHWIKTLLPDLLKQANEQYSLSSHNNHDSNNINKESNRNDHSNYKHRSKPQVLTILALGTDDASLPHRRQHVSVSAFKQNLRSIIDLFRYPSETAQSYEPVNTRFILVTPAPVHDEMWHQSLRQVEMEPDRFDNVTQQYVDAVVELGQELHLPVVNLYREIMCQIEGTCMIHESDKLYDYLMDGLHLKRLGNQVLVHEIMKTVAKEFPDLHPNCWPSIYPGYSTLDPGTEQRSLTRHC